MKYLYLDTETRSGTDIKKGIYAYIRDPHFKVLLISWAVDNGKVHLCTPDNIPQELKEALKSNCTIVMHNGKFDIAFLKQGKIATINPSRLLDTYLLAREQGLPGGLSKLCDYYKIGDLAKKDGLPLIKTFCIPKNKGEFNKPEEFPEKWAEFEEYARYDIHSLRVIHKKMTAQSYA